MVKIHLLFLIKMMTFDCYALGKEKNNKTERHKESNSNTILLSLNNERRGFGSQMPPLERSVSTRSLVAFANLLNNLSQ